MPPSTRSTLAAFCARPVGPHRLEQVAGLVADAFQRGAGEFGRAGVAGQAEERAARLGIPVGRAEADEGRHEIDVLRRIGVVGERAGLAGLLDDAEPVAQPLHGGAGDEDRAFQRVGALAAELVGDGGEQPVLRGDRRRAGVEQGEAAGAVGRLHHAGREAGLADGGGLLVAGDAADRDAAAEQLGHGVAEIGGAVLHLRQQRARHAQDRSRSSSHSPRVDVEEQGARGVGGVGGVHLAAGQPPQQKAVDGAEGEFAALGAFARAGDVVEHPGDLGAGEIGVEQQAGLRRDRRLVAFGLQSRADVGGAAVLPDDGAVDGLAGRAVPHHRGLALVGDADGGDVRRVGAGLLQRLAAGRRPSRSRCPRARARPSRRPGNAAETPAARSRRSSVRDEHDGARGGRALVDGQYEGHDVASRIASVLRQGKRIGDGSSI